MFRSSRARYNKPTYGKQLLIGGFILTTTFLIGFGVWYLTRLPALTIAEVTVSGGVTIPQKTVEESVWTALEGTYYGLIPKRFVYLYPEDKIMTVLRAIPRLSEVTLTRTDTTLAVTFEEYVPYALWCAEDQVRCLFIDEAGYAFAEAPQLSGGALLRFVIEDAVLLPQQTIPLYDEVVRAVQLGADIEKQFMFEVTDVAFKQNGDRVITLGNGALLLTSSAQDDETTKENLAAVLRTEKFAHLSDEPFAYIDLRFGDKVFVNKLGDQGTTTASTTTETEGE